jgi:hypothetical protein
MATNDGETGDRPHDYVGYRHPPKQHRFQDGNKANPDGRKGKPRAERDFLDEPQRLLIDGKWRWVTRDQLIDHALYKAVVTDGNVSAAKLLEARRQVRLSKRAHGKDADALSPEEQEALFRAAARQLRRDGDSEPDGSA